MGHISESAHRSYMAPVLSKKVSMSLLIGCAHQLVPLRQPVRPGGSCTTSWERRLKELHSKLTKGEWKRCESRSAKVVLPTPLQPVMPMKKTCLSWGIPPYPIPRGAAAGSVAGGETPTDSTSPAPSKAAAVTSAALARTSSTSSGVRRRIISPLTVWTSLR